MSFRKVTRNCHPGRRASAEPGSSKRRLSRAIAAAEVYWIPAFAGMTLDGMAIEPASPFFSPAP
jgi:hypothetical protein